MADEEQRVTKGEKTRRRILDTAAELLGREGYRATSLSDIAEAVSMQVGSLYYHFDSKDSIVEEVLAVGIDHATAAIDESLTELGEADGRARFETAMRAYAGAVVADSDFTRANIRCYDEVPPEIRERNKKRIREFTIRWEELYEAGVADGSLRADVDPVVMVRMMIPALNSTVRWFHPGRLSTDDVAAMFTKGFVEGVARPKS